MKKTTTTMGMQATVMLGDKKAQESDISEIFSYFQHVDDVFSTYKKTSEISRVNDGLLSIAGASKEVQDVLALCKKAEQQTQGYFTMYIDDTLDPSGLVKGYAIYEAAKQLRKKGYKNFFVEIAGDVEVAGKKEKDAFWKIGIENPFKRKEIVKVIQVTDCGVATSGNYKQGNHIYNPITQKQADDIASMTVVAANVQDADILATAAFAMGEKGILFLESLKDVEGYMIRKDHQTVYTSGFEKFVLE